MFRNGLTLITLGALLGGGLLGSCLGAGAADKTGVVADEFRNLQVRIEPLDPFTHLAYIPAGSDVRTIRFEKAKTVKVPTQITYTTDPDYCAELDFRDPGGSLYCPQVETGSPTTAYEVTYSFRDQPLASDEYGDTYFTFHVYFHSGELPPAVRNAVSTRKLHRAEAAEYFTVTISREPAQRLVIDEARSHFCDTTLRDGSWIYTDPDCRNEVHYKTITTASDYLAVRVDPVVSR